MTNLKRSIDEIIDKFASNFIKIVSSKHCINEDDLRTLWKEVTEQSTDVTEVKADVSSQSPSIKSSSSPPPTPVNKSSPSLKSKCPYILKKGNREGESCNSTVKKGLNYCSRHKRYEHEEPKPKKNSSSS